MKRKHHSWSRCPDPYNCLGPHDLIPITSESQSKLSRVPNVIDTIDVTDDDSKKIKKQQPQTSRLQITPPSHLINSPSSQFAVLQTSETGEPTTFNQCLGNDGEELNRVEQCEHSMNRCKRSHNSQAQSMLRNRSLEANKEGDKGAENGENETHKAAEDHAEDKAEDEKEGDDGILVDDALSTEFQLDKDFAQQHSQELNNRHKRIVLHRTFSIFIRQWMVQNKYLARAMHLANRTQLLQSLLFRLQCPLWYEKAITRIEKFIDNTTRK